MAGKRVEHQRDGRLRLQVGAEFDLDQPPGHGFLGSLEVKVVLEPADLGEFEVRDLITQVGPSLEGALEACANTFMDVTFPPLEALFTGKRPRDRGPGH